MPESETQQPPTGVNNSHQPAGAMTSQNTTGEDRTQSKTKEEYPDYSGQYPWSSPEVSDESYPRCKIVYRDGWGAVPPKTTTQHSVPVSTVMFTYTGTKECSNTLECTDMVQSIQRRDMYERDMPDIQYNFLVGGDGIVYEGRGWAHMPDKDIFHYEIDDNCVQIAYIGNFAVKDPMPEFVRAGTMLIADGGSTGKINRVIDIIPLRSNMPFKVDILEDLSPKLSA